MVTNTKSKSKAGSKKSTPTLAQVTYLLINKYRALPCSVVRDYAQKATHKRYTQEVISDSLRKLYAAGKISRLTRGVYCANGLT